PVVTSVGPVDGPSFAGRWSSDLGSGFTGATSVKFGATNATGFTVDTDGQITATAPAHAAGTVDVSVTTVGGTSANTAADDYTFVAAPSISSLAPTSGPSAGGNSVVITGSRSAGGPSVKFGATDATGFTVDTDGQITATAPAHAAATVHVTVSTAGGTSTTSIFDEFTFVAAPTVTSVSPTEGPSAGGNSVVISGS